MSASVSDSLIEIPLPANGLNTDSAQGPTGYASEFVNFIPGESRQLRVRRGWTPRANFRSFLGAADVVATGTGHAATKLASINAGAICIGSATWGTKHILSFVQGYDNDPILPEIFQNQGWGAFPFPGAGLRAFGVLYDSAAHTVTNLASATAAPWWSGYTGVWPLGDAVVLGDRTFWVSFRAGWQGEIWSWGGAVPSTNPAYLNAATQTVQSAANGATDIGLATNANSASLYAFDAAGMLMQSAEITNVQWTYKIEDHPEQALLYLTEPYGRGAPLSEVPTLAASETWNVAPIMKMSIYSTPPQSVRCLNVFQGRLFAGAGRSALSGGRTLAWSSPGNPDKWPSQNYILLDGDNVEPILALQTAGNIQLIHMPTRTFQLTGYDEDTFQLDQVAGSLGCIDPRATTSIDDRVYWLAENGVWSSDGRSAPRQESHRTGTIGVTSYMKAQLNRIRISDGVPAHALRAPALSAVDKTLLVSTNYSTLVNAPATLSGPKTNYQMAMGTQSGAWSMWGVDQALQGANQDYTPYYYFRTKSDRTFAVLPWQIVELTDCWREELTDGSMPSGQTPFMTSDSNQDVAWNNSSVSTNLPIRASVTFSPLQIKRGYTVRIREFEVDHATESTSADGVKSGFDLQLTSDPERVTAAQSGGHNLGTTSSTVEVAPGTDRGLFVTQRFDLSGTTVPLEGARFTVRIDKPSTAAYKTVRTKIYSIYAKLELVRVGRVL